MGSLQPIGQRERTVVKFAPAAWYPETGGLDAAKYPDSLIASLVSVRTHTSASMAINWSRIALFFAALPDLGRSRFHVAMRIDFDA